VQRKQKQKEVVWERLLASLFLNFEGGELSWTKT
jgi:hypothetical protein